MVEQACGSRRGCWGAATVRPAASATSRAARLSGAGSRLRGELGAGSLEPGAGEHGDRGGLGRCAEGPAAVARRNGRVREAVKGPQGSITLAGRLVDVWLWALSEGAVRGELWACPAAVLVSSVP